MANIIFGCSTRTFKTIISVSFLSIPLLAAATNYADDDYLTGNWGGGRDSLKESGVHFGLTYTAQPAALISGGDKHGSTYLHNINGEMIADLDKMFGLTNTTFTMKFSSRHGDNLSEDNVAPADIYGEYFQKSQEVYGGQTTKLVNFQLTTKINDSLTLDYGRLVMNDLYLRSDLYCNFMNNASCGSPKGVFAPYALNAYPDAAMGLSATLTMSEALDIRAGVFDGGWREQGTNGLDWDIGNDGISMIAEAQYFIDRARNGGTPKVIKVGVNHNTGTFSNYKTGNEEDDYTSLYALTDWPLYRENTTDTQGLGVFASYVYNPDSEITALPNSINTGLVYQGLIDGRDKDKLGLLITYYEHSKYNTYTLNGNTYERNPESVFELNYNFKAGNGIEIMPDIQYVINPNGSRQLDDALIVGLKFNVNL